jgi:hypothetical protein
METKGERSFSFLRVNQRKAKPRTRGLTEIRGPYYFGCRAAVPRRLVRTSGDGRQTNRLPVWPRAPVHPPPQTNALRRE